MKRIFLVGSPRSGTTLLQGILASNPNISTEFELHLPIYNKSMIRFIHPKRYGEFHYLAKKANLDIEYQGMLSLNKLIRSFAKAKDKKAIEEHKTAWIAKSNHNTYILDLIEKNIKNVKIIHILRDAKDCIASMMVGYEISWPGMTRKEIIQMLIDEWNRQINITLNRKKDVKFHFENLTNNPKKVLDIISSYTGMKFTYEDYEKYGSKAQEVVTKMSNMKYTRETKKIEKIKSRFEHLPKEEQDMILEGTKKLQAKVNIYKRPPM